MRIGFFSWRDIIHRPANANGVIVSVRDPGADLPNFERGWKAVHTEVFHDIDGQYGGFKTMNVRQAWRIAAFVESYAKAGIDEIAIHCHYGESRSAAVAVVVDEHHGVKLHQAVDGANPLVLRRMRLAYALYRILHPFTRRPQVGL